jgi:hypothetical protein
MGASNPAGRGSRGWPAGTPSPATPWPRGGQALARPWATGSPPTRPAAWRPWGRWPCRLGSPSRSRGMCWTPWRRRGGSRAGSPPTQRPARGGSRPSPGRSTTRPSPRSSGPGCRRSARGHGPVPPHNPEAIAALQVPGQAPCQRGIPPPPPPPGRVCRQDDRRLGWLTVRRRRPPACGGPPGGASPHVVAWGSGDGAGAPTSGARRARTPRPQGREVPDRCRGVRPRVPRPPEPPAAGDQGRPYGPTALLARARLRGVVAPRWSRGAPEGTGLARPQSRPGVAPIAPSGGATRGRGPMATRRRNLSAAIAPQ